MGITTSKQWQVACDATTPQGQRGCDTVLVFEQGCESEWSAEGHIFNRGQLDTHLRRTGWTLGKVVLCPAHAGGDA